MYCVLLRMYKFNVEIFSLHHGFPFWVCLRDPLSQDVTSGVINSHLMIQQNCFVVLGVHYSIFAH